MKSPLLLGLSGIVLTAEEEVLLHEIQPYGIILFTRNYQNVRQIKNLIKTVESITGADTSIAVDHEGGRVVRFPEALPCLPAPYLLGEERDPEKVRRLSREAGNALREWGITLNLAPVVDVLRPNAHPSMRERCFGSDPILVSEMSVAFIEGMHEARIQCTAKHFPGIGAAPDDMHEVGTAVTLGRQDLKAFYYPFRTAIAAGVDTVMMAHAFYPALDGIHPATFSQKIIQENLRDELEFSGIIISDDLEMGAVEKNYSIESATQACLKAGCDLASVCHDTNRQWRAYQAIKLKTGP